MPRDFSVIRVGSLPLSPSLHRGNFRLVRYLIRPVAVLLSFVLLQLVLVESGYACGITSDRSSTGASMPGMPMPGDTNQQPAPSDDHQAPCRFPWAPNGCQSMAPCAPTALTVSSFAVAPEAPAPVALVELLVLPPLSISLAPELPPPRA